MTTTAIRIARLPVTLDGTHTVTRPLVEVATGTPVTTIGVIDVVRADSDGLLLRLVGDDDTTGMVRVFNPSLVLAHRHELVKGVQVVLHGRVFRVTPDCMPIISATAIVV